MDRIGLTPHPKFMLILALVVALFSSYPPALPAQAVELTLIKDFIPGIDSSNPGSFFTYGGVTYFSAFEPTSGVELWRTDGTALGTVRVADLVLGNDSSAPANFLEYQGRLYFLANQSGERRVLWQLDALHPQPSVSDSTNALSETESVGGLFLFQQHLLFFTQENGAAGGWALWQTDGTLTGTIRLTSLQTSGFFASLGNTAELHGLLYFVVVESLGMGTNYALWRTDGTPIGTQRVAALGGGKYVKVTGPLRVHDRLFFTRGPYPELGKTLFSSDGTSAEMQDVALIPNAGFPAMTTVGNRLLIAPEVGELWYSDGRVENTAILKKLNPVGDSNPTLLTRTANFTYFRANDAGGAKLWRTTGLPETTQPVTHSTLNTLIANPEALQVIDNQLYFLAEIEPSHSVLWRAACDGTTVEPLKQVALTALAAGTATRSGLLLQANDGLLGNELWLLKEAPNGVLLSPPLATGSSGQLVTIPIELGNRSAALATGTMTVTATISSELTYQSDTSGITPTQQANTLTWNLPVDLSGCRSQHFDLRLKLPEAALGTSYRATFTLNPQPNETAIADNRIDIEILVTQALYLPYTARYQ